MSNFIINLADLNKILENIKVAEAHAAGGDLVEIIGADATLLPVGLRTVDGSFNQLLSGNTQAGAADTLFPRLLDPAYRNDLDGDVQTFAPGVSIANTNYDPNGVLGPNAGNPFSVADADPRIISNLIVDQTLNNPAALAAALLQAGSTNVSADVATILAAKAAFANIGALQTALQIAQDNVDNVPSAADISIAEDEVTLAQGERDVAADLLADAQTAHSDLVTAFNSGTLVSTLAAKQAAIGQASAALAGCLTETCTRT